MPVFSCEQPCQQLKRVSRCTSDTGSFFKDVFFDPWNTNDDDDSSAFVHEIFHGPWEKSLGILIWAHFQSTNICDKVIVLHYV